MFFFLRSESYARTLNAAAQRIRTISTVSRCKNKSPAENLAADERLILSAPELNVGRRSDAAEHDVDRAKLTFVLLDIKCHA